MRLIIDTDAGVDDAQAILMALCQPGVTVEAITTLTGNVHVDKVNPNVFTLLEIAERDVPVYQGATQPLLPGYWEPEVRVHGEDGLGNYQHRPPTKRQLEPTHAAVELVRRANEAPGELTLVALGPLTNVALACRLDPEFPHKLKQFFFMGGTIHAMGNTRIVSAEFNFFCDPEAALIALDAFPMSTMLSWETTVKHPFSWEQYDALIAHDTVMGRFLKDTTITTVTFLRRMLSLPGYLLPDPLAMAVALEPDLIKHSEKHHVTVEAQGQFTRGQSVVDYAGLNGRDANVNIVVDLDTDGVYALYQRMVQA